MKRAIFYIMLIFGMILSVCAVCAADSNDTQVIPSDDFVQMMPNDDVSVDENADSHIFENNVFNQTKFDQIFNAFKNASKSCNTTQYPENGAAVPGKDPSAMIVSVGYGPAI